MKKSKKRRKGQSAQKQKKLLSQTVNANAAGIDVGAEELVVAVGEDKCDDPVRTFDTFTESIYKMRDWLIECGIDTVAMESTGNYWITPFQVLEAADIKVCLVNARDIKGVPGRPKTDVLDAQWIQRLHQAGLLKSLVPSRCRSDPDALFDAPPRKSHPALLRHPAPHTESID